MSTVSTAYGATSISDGIFYKIWETGEIAPIKKFSFCGEKIDSFGKNKSKVLEAMDFLHLLEILSKIILYENNLFGKSSWRYFLWQRVTGWGGNL